MTKAISDLSRETPASLTTSFYYSRRIRVQFSSGSELVTKQAMKDECDINNILKQYKRTGIIAHINAQEPIYTDLPDALDYQTALHTQMAADDAFATLPSVVRAYFDNDPSRLLAALNDPSQRGKLTELGIIRKPEQPQPAGNPANQPPTGGELVQHPDRL